jgi:methyl-accepting chemotaxis protein
MLKKESTINRRKNYFIKKDFQLSFILKFCTILLAGIIISTLLLILLSRGTLTSSFENSQLTIKNTAAAILPSILLCNLLTLGLITIVLTLLVSHKLAGPMFRFQKEIEKMGAGNLTQKIQLRDKDQIESLAKSLDSMRGSLKEKIQTIRSDVAMILNTASSHDAPQEVVEQLKHLQQQVENNFKV